MTLKQEILSLILAGWQFWYEGDKLRFRAPRAAAGEAQMAFLRAHKAEILDLLARDPALFRCVPLSHGQRALWFLWLLAPHSSAYNQSLPLVISAGADAGLWREACRILSSRHEILRARFGERDGEPLQTFGDAAEIFWAESDATGLAESELATALEAAHGRPFDLAVDAPLRCHWFARGEGRAVLLLTLHHIVCDAWSLEVMRRELQRIAAALREGGLLPDAPAHQYRDFVHWQRDLLAGGEGARLLAFWRSRLLPAPPPLLLPADRPRPALAGYRGANVSVVFPEVLALGLRELAQREEATLNVVLLALWCVLLQRLSGQDEFVVGAPSAGRSLAEFAGVVGYFVDPVATPVRLSGNPTFRECLARLRAISRETLAHRDYPFMLLVEKLNLPRDPSRSPLFDVTFNFLSHRENPAAAELGTLSIAQADGKFDLTLTVIDDGRLMTAALGYNLGLFERATAERFAALLRRLAEAVVADPEQRLSRLSLQDAAARLPVLRGKALENSPERVHQSILAWCAKTPDAHAVACAGEVLTYRQMGERVAALAARLRENGATEGALVGINLPRCVDFVVALLAVLAAGAAYVPLDPDLPPALRGRMLKRCGARLLVARRGAVVAEWEGRILHPDEQPAAASPAPLSFVASPKNPADAPAYVIFTSGSTGEPKGVAVSHAALGNYCASIRDDLDLPDGASGMVISALNADLGYTLLFPVLIGGGTLHLAGEELVGNPAAFADYFTRHSIDALKIVPSHLAALLHGRTPVLPRRALILGGEASSCAWLAALLENAECRIYNHYGPTETTVGVLTHCATAADLQRYTTLPLSRAVAGMAIYLLDGDLSPVAPGMPGELVIGGPGLAQGYVGDPAQSAERFVTLADIGRVYRSGDLARCHSDGRIEILGRADRQIKLHGQRIEPGQVENRLAALPEVAHCAVLADVEGPGASHLIAWVAVRDGAAAADLETRLRAALADALPVYMIPARWVFCAALPVTPNGKLDNAALRALASASVMPEATLLSRPRDSVELRLAHLWSDLLGHPVGLHDDFFRSGGHSLLAVRLMGRISDEFGVRLPLAALLTHPSIAALAEVLRGEAAPGGGPLLRLQRGSCGMPLLLLPGAGGNVLYFNALVNHLPGDLPVWGLQAIGIGDGEIAPDSIEELAASYVKVLLAMPEFAGGVHLVGHSFGGLVAYEIARQLAAVGHPVGLLAVLDNAAPRFDDAARYADWSDEDWLHHVALRIGKLYGVTLSADGRGPAGPRLFDVLLQAGLLPSDTRYEFFHRYIGVYRANVIAAAIYQPKGKLMNIPLSLFTAADADAALGQPVATDPGRGWQTYVAAPLRCCETPGSHLSMLLEPHAAVLAAQLRGALGGAA